MNFSEEQINRYARHILLKEVGGEGQQKLLNAKVLVIGAGGLGSPNILYLAAAGVGTIGVVDDDVVDLSNLQRQVLHGTADINRSKVVSAAESVDAINPDVKIIRHNERITADNAVDMIDAYDVVADGCDNFSTRFLVNDVCVFQKKTLVSAAILRFDAQLATYRAFPGPNGGEAGPCYRCIFREAPPDGQISSCAEAGVMGALCGMVGSFQATEVIKEILGIGESMAGSLIVMDGLSTTFRKIAVKRDPGCPVCGDNPTITDLGVHA